MLAGEATPIRSTFVTVLAWIFIVLAGFATLISILQNVMIALVFPAAEMQAAVNRANSEPGVPWFASFMFNHFQLIFLFFLLVCGSTLAAAIGLLKRKNWARLLFVTLMVLGIIWNVVALVLMLVFVSSFGGLPVPANPAAAAQFDVMVKIMFGVNMLIVVAFASLLGWIIKRLISEDIRREFSAG